MKEGFRHRVSHRVTRRKPCCAGGQRHLGGYPGERLIFSLGASLGGTGFGATPGGRGSDFFGGGPEYFKFSPFTWQAKELIPVLMAKPAE